MGSRGGSIGARYNMLLSYAWFNDLVRISVELGLYSMDDQNRVRGKQCRYEFVDFLPEQVWRDGDLLDSSGDGLHDLVMPLGGRVDLLLHVVDKPEPEPSFLAAVVRYWHSAYDDDSGRSVTASRRLQPGLSHKRHL